MSSTSTSWYRRIRNCALGLVTIAVVVVVGGPCVYLHFIEAPAPAQLALATTVLPTTVPGTVSAPLAGTWKIGTGSIVRYRVKETLFGQSATAVGTTNTVTGSLTIVGTQLTKASFAADMTTVKSDQSQRNAQFQGRIMDTAKYPTGTFTLTSPIDLAPIPTDGTQRPTPPTAPWNCTAPRTPSPSR